MRTTGRFYEHYETSTVIRPSFGIRTIFETLGEVNLNSEDYLVIGGAAMVLQGAKRKTPDIDMLVSSRGWFHLLATLEKVEEVDPPYGALSAGATNTTLKVSGLPMPLEATDSVGDGNYPLSFDEHWSRADFVAGVPCLPLAIIRDAKLALRRLSDIEDIIRINSYLALNE